MDFGFWIFILFFFHFHLIIYYRPLSFHSTPPKCRPPSFLSSFRLPFSSFFLLQIFFQPVHLTLNLQSLSPVNLEGSSQSALSIPASFLRLFAPESPHCGVLTENWRTFNIWFFTSLENLNPSPIRIFRVSFRLHLRRQTRLIDSLQHTAGPRLKFQGPF